MAIDIVRAWRDEAYRASLSEEQRAALPESPVGPVELSDAELSGSGGVEAAASNLATMSGSFCTCPTKSLLCSLCDC